MWPTYLHRWIGCHCGSGPQLIPVWTSSCPCGFNNPADVVYCPVLLSVCCHTWSYWVSVVIHGPTECLLSYMVLLSVCCHTWSYWCCHTWSYWVSVVCHTWSYWVSVVIHGPTECLLSVIHGPTECLLSYMVLLSVCCLSYMVLLSVCCHTWFYWVSVVIHGSTECLLSVIHGPTECLLSYMVLLSVSVIHGPTECLLSYMVLLSVSVIHGSTECLCHTWFYWVSLSYMVLLSVCCHTWSYWVSVVIHGPTECLLSYMVLLSVCCLCHTHYNVYDIQSAFCLLWLLQYPWHAIRTFCESKMVTKGLTDQRDFNGRTRLHTEDLLRREDCILSTRFARMDPTECFFVFRLDRRRRGMTDRWQCESTCF